MTIYVLDSSAIVCFLRNENGAAVVERLLVEPANQHYIHAVNWIELRYLERRGHFPNTTSISDFLKLTGIAVSNELALPFSDKVASFKANYPPFALGDCFAVALAQILDATLVTADHGELDKVADANECPVLFIR
jgi:PIN domain nuclease of toxin-antitoxin system